MVGKVGCLIYLEALLVCCLGGSFPKVDLSGAVKKKGQLQVLDFKLYLKGIFVFQVPVYWIYLF